MKYTYLERQEYELTCISPIHIGNGEVLKTIDYVYDAKQQKMYFLDETQWRRFLVDRNLLMNFLDYISDKGRPILRTWMHSVGLSLKDIQPVVARVCRVSDEDALSGKSSRGKSLNDVRPCMTSVRGIPYIPGSSLKGALRSGILFNWLQRHEAIRRQYWNEVMYNCDFKKRNSTFPASNLEKDAFSKLHIQETRNGVVKSALRGLSVSDTVENTALQDTILLQKIDASTWKHRSRGNENTISVFRECIPAGTKLRFSITFDKRMMATLGIASIADVIQASKQFTAYNLAMEEDVFGSDYTAEFAEAKGADILLGGGVGFQSKTVFYPLAPSFAEGKRVLARKLNDSFKMHHHFEYDKAIAPRTLKLARAKTDRWIMGLCRLREV